MKKMIPAIALVVCLAATGFAQIWTEDFTGQEGKGLSGTVALGVVTNMTGVTNWTVAGGQDLDGDTSLNWWQVTNGVFQGQDVGAATADWESKAIDISAENLVSISMDLAQVENGFTTGPRYFKVFYKLDGGAEQLLLYVSMTNQASYDGTTFTSPGIDVSAASTLSVLTRIYVTVGGDGWQFDNVVVAAGAGPTNVQFTAASASVTESSGSYTVTVYKTAASGNVSGEVSLGGTAAEGAGVDYTIDTTNFTMNGATTSATFVVTINDDTATESGETIILTLANVAGGTISVPGVFTLTIFGNDMAEPAIWINEVNYDTPGTDENEFVEVAGPAGVVLSNYYMAHSDGNDGSVIGDIQMEGTIDDEGCGYGAVAFDALGLQNGPDGVALISIAGGVTSLVQFISYEGTFTATDGPASGYTSSGIGTQADNIDTLQLGGTATNYSAFAWETNTVSKNSLNVNQIIAGCVPAPVTNVHFTAAADSLAESSVSYTVTVVKTVADGNVSGQVQLGGTAAPGAGSDYTISATNFTLNGAVTSATLIVTINDDAATEPGETIILTLANIAGGAISTPSQFTLTVLGNDLPEPAVWINEINYDPLGSDSNEYVEIAGPAAADLSVYQLVLYNGSATYGSVTNLSGSIDDEGCGLGAVAFVFAANGLQNGPADGLALATVNAGVTTLVQFLSYEGAITGAEGPAQGFTSTSVGTQTDSTNTLQLGGSASAYSGFAWESAVPSEGALNVNQSVAGCSPAITITNPPTESVSVPNATDNYTIDGICSTSVIGHLSWTNSLTGGSGMFSAATDWTLGFMIDVGANVVTVSGTNVHGSAASDTVTITREEPTPQSGMIALFNEVEFNSTGTDTGDYIEVIAPAGTNLVGCFIVHYNGSDASDGEVWRFTFPSFVVQDAGITDTNGWALGFCVIGQTAGMQTANFELPGGLLGADDGIVLYDQYTNILDAMAWAGAGDLATDDPGGLVTTGDPAARNYLRVVPGDTANTNTTVQSPDKVLADDGTGWTLILETPGAINGGQTSGQIDITGGGTPAVPVLAITNPPAVSLVVANAYSAFDIQGIANTNVIGQIQWTNDLTGGAGAVAAATSWSVPAVSLAVGVNTITVTGTNGIGAAVTDSVVIQREAAATYLGTPQALINEVEFNSAFPGDSNDFVEIIAPAGSNLVGCFLVHYNGSAGSDDGEWRFDFPSFVVPDAGITDTNGVHLGFCVIAKTNTPVVNADFEMPASGLQTGPDGLVLYDAASNILDAVAWGGAGDLTIDDPGVVFTIGDTRANNYLHITGNDGADDSTTRQAPNDVLGDDGTGWLLIPETPGAINGGQTSGVIIVTSAAGPVNPDTDGDGMPDAWETLHFGTLTNEAAGNTDNDPASNLDEYLADTIPTNSDSFLTFVSFTLGAGSNVAKWKGGVQAVQLIESNSSLVSGEWWILSTFPAPTPVTNTLGIGPSPAAEFDRVRAHR